MEENQRYKEIDQLFYEHNKSNKRFLNRDELLNSIAEYSKRNKNEKDLKFKIEYIWSQLDVENLNKVSFEAFRTLFSLIIYENMLTELIHLFKSFDKKRWYDLLKGNKTFI